MTPGPLGNTCGPSGVPTHPTFVSQRVPRPGAPLRPSTQPHARPLPSFRTLAPCPASFVHSVLPFQLGVDSSLPEGEAGLAMMAAQCGKGGKQSQRVVCLGSEQERTVRAGKVTEGIKDLYSSHEYHTTGENQRFGVAYSSRGRPHYVMLSGKSKLQTIHTA